MHLRAAWLCNEAECAPQSIASTRSQSSVLRMLGFLRLLRSTGRYSTSYARVPHSSCISDTCEHSATTAKLEFQQGCWMSGNPGQTGKAQSSFPSTNKIPGQIRYTVAHTYSYKPQVANDHSFDKRSTWWPRTKWPLCTALSCEN